MPEPLCYYCEHPAEAECHVCGRFYCSDHGDEVCLRCLSPAAAIPSSIVFRGSLLVLVIASIAAIFLWVDPPRSASSGPLVTIVTPVGSGARPAEPASRATEPPATASSGPSQTSAATAVATAVTPATAVPTAASGQTYTIVPGDTLEGIAAAHNTTAAQIAALNPGLNPNLIPGTVLKLP